jgi:hypothetical protein
MEGSGFRPRLRAGRDLLVLDRVVGGLLGVDVPRAPRLWGDEEAYGGNEDATGGRARDVGAERDLIRTAVRLAHQRRARKRPVVNWIR